MNSRDKTNETVRIVEERKVISTLPIADQDGYIFTSQCTEKEGKTEVT